MFKGLSVYQSHKTLKPFRNVSKSISLRVTLCDTNEEVALALASQFQYSSGVRIIWGNALKIKTDAIVSPANSFGDMGGGIDKVIDDLYKGEAQKKVIKTIRNDYLGELPVGTALILPMSYRKLPYLIVAPTMRIPGNVSGTLNAYLAMRASLVAVLKHNETCDKKIRDVVVPALCTGVGRMPFKESAQQMLKAYENVVMGQWQDVIHPSVAPYVMHRQNLS